MPFNCEEWLKSQFQNSTASSEGWVSDGNPFTYYKQLLQDRSKLVELHPLTFHHLANLLDREIRRIREENDIKPESKDEVSTLPDEFGASVNIQEKIYISNERYPGYNFAGRILGPRGMTVKQLEQRTGCKIEVRGKGSFKTAAGEGDEQLHVVITAQDSQARAKAKMEKAKEELAKLVNPKTDGIDEIKKRQLMELAIINGNYRPQGSRPEASASRVPGSMPPMAAMPTMPTPSPPPQPIYAQQPLYFLVRPQMVPQGPVSQPMMRVPFSQGVFIDPAASTNTMYLSLPSPMHKGNGACGDRPGPDGGLM